MPRKFDLLVFDWDGTLMDSAGAIAICIQAACGDLGLPVPDRETASHVIGLGLKDALLHAAPTLAVADYPKLAERYRYHYLSRDHELVLFPCIPDTLRALQQAGFTLAVATGKSRAGLDRVLNGIGLGPIFAATRCADESFSKPHPAMLLELTDQLDTPLSRTLMIGDTTHDLQMAINAGVTSLGVSYGAHPKESLLKLNPLGCLDHAEELLPWLMSNG